MAIISVCNCNTYKSVTLTFTPPSVAPASGYEVGWRTVDSNGIPGNWNILNNIVAVNGSITLNSIPTCCNVEGYVKAKCADNQFGQQSNFTISASATYNASLTFGACDASSGIANYTLTGTPGQIVKLRLKFQGNIAFTNPVGLNGSCAWLYGRISATNGSVVSGSSLGTIPGTTYPQLQSIGDQDINVSIGPTGSTPITTLLTTYNVMSTTLVTLSSSIQIISIDGVDVSIPATTITCRLNSTASGCLPPQP